MSRHTVGYAVGLVTLPIGLVLSMRKGHGRHV
jgi:hypothetical protein